MAASEVHVNRSGSPASSIKVVLSFANGGVTGAVYTDRSGKAVIMHDGVGTATVFADGVNKGTMRTPGTRVVEL